MLIATIFVFSLAVILFLLLRVQHWMKANDEYKAYKLGKSREKDIEADAAWQRNKMMCIC